MKKLISTLLVLSLLSSCSSSKFFTEWREEIKADMSSKFGEPYPVTNVKYSTDQPQARVEEKKIFKYSPANFYYVEYSRRHYHRSLLGYSTYSPTYIPNYTELYTPKTITIKGVMHSTHGSSYYHISSTINYTY